MNNHFDIKEIISISTGKVYRTTDSLIVFHPNPKLETLSIEEINEMKIAFEKVLRGGKLPYITDFSDAISFSKEEKNLIRENLAIFSSVANVVTKSVARVILNIFLQFQIREPHIKMFATLEEAKKWSLDQLNKKNEKP